MLAPVDPYTGENLVQYALRRNNALATDMSSYLQHWTDISLVMMPRGTRFNASEAGSGNKRNRDLINSTAVYSLNILSSGLMTGVTSPSRPWFQLKTQNPELNKKQAVKVWLDEVRNLMVEVFIKSNLYTTLPLVYKDLGAFGTSCFAVMEDEEDMIRCYHFPIGSYKLSGGHRGDITAMFRTMKMNTLQLVSKFGIDQCSNPVQDSFRRKTFDNTFEIMHVVERNPDHKPDKLESRHLPWRSYYFEKNSNEQKLLSLSGFYEQSVLSPRWSVIGEDAYGISPGMDALGDTQQIQKMEKRKLQLLDMLLQPPRSVPVGLRDEYVGTLGGEFTFVNSAADAEAVKPNYVPNPYIDHISAEIALVENRVRRLLHESLFLMIVDMERGNVTATEIQARQQEKMMVLGPVMDRLNDELLDPLIKRTLGILERSGKMPQPPEELQGQAVNVEYISVMAQAMKLQGVVAVERFVGFIGSLAAVRPDVLDKLNSDEVADGFADMVGVPPRMVNDNDTAIAARAARAKEAQAQQAMAMAQQGADAAKTLSETQVSTPSMLSAMAGNLQGSV